MLLLEDLHRLLVIYRNTCSIVCIPGIDARAKNEILHTLDVQIQKYCVICIPFEVSVFNFQILRSFFQSLYQILTSVSIFSCLYRL